MYGMNKKMFKPVGGGMRAEKTIAPNSGSGMSANAAKQALNNSSMKKLQVLRKLRGA